MKLVFARLHWNLIFPLAIGLILGDNNFNKEKSCKEKEKQNYYCIRCQDFNPLLDQVFFYWNVPPVNIKQVVTHVIFG